MVLVDLAISLWRVVEKKQKNPSIFFISAMICCQPSFDGRLAFLPPIWLIFAVLG